MLYYINLCSNQNIDIRSLRKKIKLKEYSRLTEETINKLIQKETLEVKYFIKNLIIIKNSKNYEITSEKILQKLILDNIEDFMKELGDSFCFIGSEYKIKIGVKYNYIALLLYNIKFKCYVVVELKIAELKKIYSSNTNLYELY